jgi:predicted RNase H-like HicB family nuclease
MHLKVVITKGEDGWYVVTVPSLPGCISQGRTIKEAKQNIKEAIALYLEPEEDIEALIDTAEILSNPETLQRIEKSEMDIAHGRVKEISSIGDLYDHRYN